MSIFGFFPNIMFSVIPVLVVIGFVIVFCMIIVQAVQGASRWHKNNNSPVLCVPAKVAAKRMAVSRHTHHHHGTSNMHHHSTSTHYYATFEVESGDRMELPVPDGEYGLLVEGDQGKLTFQGTRFLSFARERAQ